MPPPAVYFVLTPILPIPIYTNVGVHSMTILKTIPFLLKSGFSWGNSEIFCRLFINGKMPSCQWRHDTVWLSTAINGICKSLPKSTTNRCANTFCSPTIYQNLSQLGVQIRCFDDWNYLLSYLWNTELNIQACIFAETKINNSPEILVRI